MTPTYIVSIVSSTIKYSGIGFLNTPTLYLTYSSYPNSYYIYWGHNSLDFKIMMNPIYQL